MSSVTVSTSPSEPDSTVRTLLTANLFGVFAEQDESVRIKKVKEVYTEDVIWFEPDRVLRGHEELSTRAGELLAQGPGFKFKADGEMSVSQNMGTLKWWNGPDDKPDLIQGVDVIIVEGGKIKLLWTAINKAPWM